VPDPDAVHVETLDGSANLITVVAVTVSPAVARPWLRDARALRQ
jgi:hypothetical protein